MRTPLAGEVAIITGADSVIGRLLAVEPVKNGASVVVVARRDFELSYQLQKISDNAGQAISMAGDATEGCARAVVNATLRSFCRMNLLISTDDIKFSRSVEQTPTKAFSDCMRTNVKSGFLFSRAVVTHMKKQGRDRILTVSTVEALRGAPCESVYIASKYAQLGVAQSMSVELHASAIKVCVICLPETRTGVDVGAGRALGNVGQHQLRNAQEVASAVKFACLQPCGTPPTFGDLASSGMTPSLPPKASQKL